MREVRVCNSLEVPIGQKKCFVIEGQDVVVFNLEGDYYAMENSCPHRGGPLSEGAVHGEFVSCPWHAWKFNIKTGQWISNSEIKLKTFSVRVVGVDIFISLEEPTS